MTEDDTFAALKKPTLYDMSEKYFSVLKNQARSMSMNDREEFFRENGWDFSVWLKEYPESKLR